MNEKIVVFGGTFLDVFIYGDDPHDARIIESPGGSGLNIAFGLFRLGFDVEFISNIGNDWKGKEILSRLRNYKFNIHGMNVLKERTGYHISKEDKPIAVDRGVNKLPLRIKEDSVERADIVIINTEIALHSFKEICSSFTGKLFIDMGPLFNIRRADININKNADAIFIGNHDLGEIEEFDIIKKGSGGASWNEIQIEGDRKEYPYRVGAGDVFDVVLITSLLMGKTERESLEYAVMISQDMTKEIKGAFNKVLNLHKKSF
ncbi:MAG: PfkB family carbohydrate kinase [Kosmotogaceae bacterium]